MPPDTLSPMLEFSNGTIFVRLGLKVFFSEIEKFLSTHILFVRVSKELVGGACW